MIAKLFIFLSDCISHMVKINLINNLFLFNSLSLCFFLGTSAMVFSWSMIICIQLDRCYCLFLIFFVLRGFAVFFYNLRISLACLKLVRLSCFSTITFLYDLSLDFFFVFK